MDALQQDVLIGTRKYRHWGFIDIDDQQHLKVTFDERIGVTIDVEPMSAAKIKVRVIGTVALRKTFLDRCA